MYWNVIAEPCGAAEAAERSDGRFVLHRHHDANGPHLDLRLEQDGYLVGWRIDGTSLESKPWATEKAPHPTQWLDQDGDAQRVDAGLYMWVERGADRRVLLLNGREGAVQVRVERTEGLPARTVRAIREAARSCGVELEDAGRLVVDGVTARRRAIERLCGLGRELDGSTFDEGVWRKALAGLSLDDIHAHLRAYEVRFDAKYPPSPVSRPETLPDANEGEDSPLGRTQQAMAIMRG